MAIIHGFGELVLVQANNVKELCASDFRLDYSQEIKKYRFFNSAKQIYEASPIQPITSEQFSLELQIANWDFEILTLIFSNTSNVNLPISTILPVAQTALALDFQALASLDFTGVAYLTDNKHIRISVNDIVPISCSEISPGLPLTIIFSLPSKPSYYSQDNVTTWI